VSAVRNALNAARYDWFGVRIGGPGASMQGLWPVLIVAIVFVFGAFFAVGRLLAGGGTPAEGSSAAPLTHAAIPEGLRGGSPIAGSVPNSITAPPPRKPAPASGAAVLRATVPGGETLTPETSGGSVRSEPASVQGEPAPSGSKAGSAGGGGGNGGKSFDSSE